MCLRYKAYPQFIYIMYLLLTKQVEEEPAKKSAREYSETQKGYWGVGTLWKYGKNTKMINTQTFPAEFIDNKEEISTGYKNRKSSFSWRVLLACFVIKQIIVS